jgi:hypothetical protein
MPLGLRFGHELSKVYFESVRHDVEMKRSPHDGDPSSKSSDIKNSGASTASLFEEYQKDLKEIETSRLHIPKIT